MTSSNPNVVVVTPVKPVVVQTVTTSTPAPAASKSSFLKIIDAIQPFAIGGLSGMFATCIIQPFDMIKVSIQLKSEEQVNHSKKISPFSVAG